MKDTEKENTGLPNGAVCLTYIHVSKESDPNGRPEKAFGGRAGVRVLS